MNFSVRKGTYLETYYKTEFDNKIWGKKTSLRKGQEYLLTALPIAHAQRILMDHLSAITPLLPMVCSIGQKLCSEMKDKIILQA